MRKILCIIPFLLIYFVSLSYGENETEIKKLLKSINTQYGAINSQLKSINSQLQEEKQARKEILYKLDFLATKVSKIESQLDKVNMYSGASNYTSRSEYRSQAIPAVYITPKNENYTSYNNNTRSYRYSNNRSYNNDNLLNIMEDVVIDVVTEPIKIIDDIQNGQYGSAIVRTALVVAASKAIGKVAKYGKRIWNSIF